MGMEGVLHVWTSRVLVGAFWMGLWRREGILLVEREARVTGLKLSLGRTREKRSSTMKLISIMVHEHIPDNDRIDSAFNSISHRPCKRLGPTWSFRLALSTWWAWRLFEDKGKAQRNESHI